ncbi:MAG: aminotransferase class IV [Motiliproteus sp.]
MSDVVYLNGEFIAAADARVSVFDRGFLFADSTYEVIPFYNGVGFRLEQHLQRLHEGLKAIRIELDIDLAPLCQQLIEMNGGGHQAVYLQVTRGTDVRRRHAISASLKPTVLLISYPIEVALVGDLDDIPGISVITTEDIRWRRCDIKTTALLANIIALQAALEEGAQEALFVADGYLTEGATSNLYVIKQGVILTPVQDSHILGGTTRSLILELARANEVPISEQPIPEGVLTDADEVWISSSTRGVLPVLKVNGITVGDGKPGPLWNKIAKLYQLFEQDVFQGKQP